MADPAARRIAFYVRATSRVDTQTASSFYLIRPVMGMPELAKVDAGAVSIQWARGWCAERTYVTGQFNASEDPVIGYLWEGTRRWQCTDINSPSLESLTTQAQPTFSDMSQPESLTDFVRYAFPSAASGEDFLVLFGHGGPPTIGLWMRELSLSDGDALAAVGQTSGAEILGVTNGVPNTQPPTPAAPMTLLGVGEGLRKAVRLNGRKLTALVSCQCFMATIESLYEYRTVCDFLLASQPLLPVPVWPHDVLVRAVLDTKQPPKTALQQFMKYFETHLQSRSKNSTISLTDMDDVATFFTCFGRFVDCCANADSKLLFPAILAVGEKHSGDIVIDSKLGLVDFRKFLEHLAVELPADQIPNLHTIIDELLNWIKQSITVTHGDRDLSGLSAVLPLPNFATASNILDAYSASCSLGHDFPAWVALLEKLNAT